MHRLSGNREEADHASVLVTRRGAGLEKQITIDPVSLVPKDASNSLADEKAWQMQLPPLSAARGRLLSISVPNSTTSSPRFTSVVLPKRNTFKDGSQNPHSIASPYWAMHRALAGGGSLHKSKSCGDGRTCAPSVDFDIAPAKPVDAPPHPVSAPFPIDKLTDAGSGCSDGEKDDPRAHVEQEREEFKCGALCLFLPGFGKAKMVKAKKDRQEDSLPAVVSRTVSLEKFECGSWASSAMNTNDEGGENPSSAANLYFDLPLELIRSANNDTNHPVTTAFIFDKDLKGVLRNGSRSSMWRKSPAAAVDSPPRHVRFSTSSHPASPASCVTPRLRKARAEFNAFLEAQTT